MEGKTCCVTGHRAIPKEKLAYVEAELEAAVTAAADEGYVRFISGFAEGVDLLFAAAVVRLKERGRPVALEAAIPYAARLKYKDPTFQKLLTACDDVTVICERYSTKSFFIRNRYMVDESALVIAIHDGRESGGTYSTMQYARTHEKEVRVIQV